MSWRTLHPVEFPDSAGHLLHDANNLVLPLTLLADPLEDSADSGEPIQQALAPIMQRLKQLTLWADPPGATETLQAQEVAVLVHSSNTDLPASQHLRVHPAALAAALRPFGQPTARVDPMNLILDFPASSTWRDAAQCGNPAAPYSVKRVGLSLTVIAAVVHAHLGSVAVYVEDGAVRVRLPLV